MKDPIAPYTIEFTSSMVTFDDTTRQNPNTHREAGQFGGGFIDIHIRLDPSIDMYEFGIEIIAALDPITTYTLEYTPGTDTFLVPLCPCDVRNLNPMDRDLWKDPRAITHREAGQFKESCIDICIQVGPSIDVIALGDEIITALKPLELNT
jgi:hypothetical protein